MSRSRLALGFFAGVLLALSAAAHSLLGWRQLAAEIAPIHAPPELVRALAIGWHFGGVAMLAFAALVLGEMIASARRRCVTMHGSLVVGLTYVGFGLTAMAVTGLDPFFLVFVAPGTMLLVVAWPSRRLPEG